MNRIIFYSDFINFYVHFWLLLSKSTLPGLFEKKGKLTKNFGGGLTTPLSPRAPEGLKDDQINTVDINSDINLIFYM